MKLKDVVKDLKVGDVLWIRTEILPFDEEELEKPVEKKHFNLSSKVISSLIGSEVYGDPEVFLGELTK